MSITGFDDAIKDQVDSYQNTVSTLRASSLLQRNTALAGIQSEVEKYGELAKIGLEFPVAIEGLKAVGGTVKRGINFVRGAGSALENIKGQLSGGVEGLAAKTRGALRTALSQGRTNSLLSGSMQGDPVNNIGDLRDVQRMAIQGTGPGDRETASSLFDRNPTVSRMGRVNASTGDAPQSIRTPLDAEGGTQTESVEQLSARFDAVRPPGGSVEMSTRNVAQAPESMYERNTNARPTAETNASGSGIELDDRGMDGSLYAPSEQNYHSITGMDNSYKFEPDDGTRQPYSNSELQSVGKDAGQPMTRPGQNPNEISQATDSGNPAQQTRLAQLDNREPAYGGKGDGEIRPATAPVATEDTTLGNFRQGGGRNLNTLASEANPNPFAGPKAPVIGAEQEISPIETAAGDLNATADTLEETGLALDTTGVGVILGGLLEGLGAITEVASVGAGAYGAVQSMVDAGKEEALRNSAMPSIKPGSLDLGGSVGVPELN